MKIAVVQFKPKLAEKRENVSAMKSYVDDIDSDIIVFPELCTTGYFFQDRKSVAAVSESFGGETVSLFQKIASKRNKIIVFGFAEQDKDKLYNSAAILLPDHEKSRVYRKTHLFYMEKFCFDPGNTGFFVVKYPDWDVNIGTMICYDWRFPEAARTLGLKGADLIVCPSNLVTPLWPRVMPTRAIESKVYLAVANRFGTEEVGGEKVSFNGQSAIYSYNGDILTSAGEDFETILEADIDPAATRKKSFNPYNDINKDRRPDMYFK